MNKMDNKFSTQRKQLAEAEKEVADMLKNHVLAVDETLKNVLQLKKDVDSFNWGAPMDVGGQPAEMRLTRKRKSEDGQVAEMGVSTRRKYKKRNAEDKKNYNETERYSGKIRKRKSQDKEKDDEPKNTKL